MRCQIDGISHKGEGVGRINGKAAFIPFTIPGETVDMEVLEDGKSFIRGKLLEVIEPSPDRCMPDCPHYYECGGCAYQHMTYARQLELKRQVVQDSLQRIGKINCEVNPVLGMKDPWRYRNKVEWHLENRKNEVCMGYYKNESHELIEIHTCKLISAVMEKLSFQLKNQVTAVREGRNGKLTVRESSRDYALLAVTDELEIQSPAIGDTPANRLSIYTKQGSKIRLVAGDPTFTEQINETIYNLSPLSFFQVNPEQTRMLVDLVKKYCRLKPEEDLLDCFCGVGSITLQLAPYVNHVVGVEGYAPAIDNARENAALNNISNCEFITGPCEKIVPQLKQNFDTVVLDPPRAGCKPELIQAIINKSPAKIIYVSCNPATLARDLAVFTKENYIIIEIQPLDMFPQTAHVETVVVLYRG